jgi:stalled ribosome rescue protein Dom34
MMRKYGIWIDSRSAWVAEVTDSGLIEAVIASEAERKPRIPGEQSRKTTRASKGFDYESNQKAHFEEQVKKYLKKLAAMLHTPAEVVVFGPGEMRQELAKVLRAKKGIAVLAVVGQARATANQKRKMVRDFFRPPTPK